MFRKLLAFQVIVLFSLLMIVAGPSIRAGIIDQPSFTASPGQTANSDCSDQAIHDKVVAAIKQGFTQRVRAENFHFTVSVSNKVVTLRGWVSGINLHKRVINNVRKTLKGLGCNATIDPKNIREADANGRRGIFLNHKAGSCPEGKVECPSNGECKNTLSECPASEVGN